MAHRFEPGVLNRYLTRCILFSPLLLNSRQLIKCVALFGRFYCETAEAKAGGNMKGTDVVDLAEKQKGAAVTDQGSPVEVRERFAKLTPDTLERRHLALELYLRRKRELQDLAIQKFLVYFACLGLGVCCMTTLTFFAFQGFHTAGFNLHQSLMHWMGGATIGSIGALATIVYKRLIRQSQ